MQPPARFRPPVTTAYRSSRHETSEWQVTGTVESLTRPCAQPDDTRQYVAASRQFASSGAGASAQTDSSLRGMLADQTALQRVATLVARGICHAELFAVDGQEIA